MAKDICSLERKIRVTNNKMNYIDFASYKKKWIFNHPSMPVAQADLLDIKPMATLRANQLWQEFVSKRSPTLLNLDQDEWVNTQDAWHEEMEWQESWESESDLSENFWQFFSMDENSIVYFCYDKQDIIETRWKIFRKYWKNFLFYDDEPLLLVKKKKLVAQFSQNGRVKLGVRP